MGARSKEGSSLYPLYQSSIRRTAIVTVETDGGGQILEGAVSQIRWAWVRIQGRPVMIQEERTMSLLNIMKNVLKT